MVKRHLLRMSAPASWPIERKTKVWVTRPNCGPHKLESCMSLNTILTEKLKYAKTSSEAKKILNNKELLLNKKTATDLKQQVGFLDVLEIPKMKEQYRMIFNANGQLVLNKISNEEAGIRICRVMNKRTIKNKKTQLNLDDGTNLLVDKDSYALGDSLVLEMPERKLKSMLKFEKGAIVYITGGKKIGTVGKIEDVTLGTGIKKSTVTVKSKKETFLTRKDYAFVIGKDKPEIKLE